MEQQALYNAYNFNVLIYNAGPGTAADDTVGLTQIGSLLCPSESIKIRPFQGYGTTSYVNNQGGPGALAAFTGVIVPGHNALNNNSNIASFGFEGITDGTSNTAMLSERLITVSGASLTVSSSNAKRAHYQSGVTMNDGGGQAQAMALYNACKGLPGSTAAQNYTFGWMWHTTMSYTTCNISYAHHMPPNSLSCTYSNAEDVNWGGTMGAITATSNHSGAVNICFADGSVKFVKDTVNLNAWWAIGSRNQGEVISADAY